MSVTFFFSVIFIAILAALALAALDKWCRDREYHRRILRELQRKEDRGGFD